MRAGTTGDQPTLVLRAGNTWLVPVAVWVFCVGAVADAAIEGTWGFLVRVVVLMAAIAFAAWLLLASPCLVVEPEGLRVVNPLRVHWIPFAALVEVRVRGLTTFIGRQESGAPRRVTSWNAPGLPRQFVPETAPVVVAIEGARRTWEQRSGPGVGSAVMVTSWRWRGGAVLVVLLVANISIWFR